MYYDIYENDIDDEHDDEDQNNHNSSNFQARSSNFFM